MKPFVVRKFGLIGYPLSHSFSKKFFSHKFQAEKITDCEYELYPIPAIADFPRLLEAVPELEGVNVTVPYKEQVKPFLDHIAAAAAEIGAVNCIRIRDGKKEGYNTDVTGFKNTLLPLLGEKPQKALILGTGGAAKAVAYVLKELAIDAHFVSRRPAGGSYAYEELTATVIRDHRLIVNASPVGTFPREKEAPDIPYHFLNARHLLYDLVYNPAETRFLMLGKQRGATIKNGYDMLVGQAEASWTIWNKAD